MQKFQIRFTHWGNFSFKHSMPSVDIVDWPSSCGWSKILLPEGFYSWTGIIISSCFFIFWLRFSLFASKKKNRLLTQTQQNITLSFCCGQDFFLRWCKKQLKKSWKVIYDWATSTNRLLILFVLGVKTYWCQRK